MHQQITILLVEDEPIVRLATKRKLERFGYAVATADDGLSAVSMAETLPRVDLILMDIDLGSGIDGTEAAKRILQIKTLPIVFHTSHSEREMVDRVRNITRYGYVLKDSGDFVLQSSIEMALDLFSAHLAQNAATEAHRESESRYRSLFENRHTPMFVIDPETMRIIDANPAASLFYGYSHENLIRMLITDINILTDDEIQAEMEVARLERRNHFLFKHRLASGEIRSVEVHSGPISYCGKTYLYSIIIDVTARTAAEEALARSEWTYRTLFESIPTGIIHFNALGVITEVNSAFTTIVGNTRETLLGLDITTIPDQRIVPNFIEALSGKLSVYLGHYRTILGKKEIFVRVKIAPLPDKTGFNGGIAVVEDLTDEKRREDERDLIEGRLRDEQRLSSVGTLADGIAHEVNNPLMAVINLAQLIVDHGEQDATLAQEIINEGERIAAIVRGLMTFSNSGRYPVTGMIPIESLIFGVTALTGEIIRHDDIEFEIGLEPGLPELACRSQQIQQVLLNLLTNARDAITAARKKRAIQGRIILRCAKTLLEGKEAVRFEVEDNANGIPDTILPRIFDPFFTTKPGRQGPGLGLSVSWSIAREHGGSLTVEKSGKTGSIFALTIPLGLSDPEPPKTESI